MTLLRFFELFEDEFDNYWDTMGFDFPEDDPNVSSDPGPINLSNILWVISLFRTIFLIMIHSIPAN